MKRILLTLLFQWFWVVITLAQTLEIHQIDVGQGDCTLILNKSNSSINKAILVDAGKVGSGQSIYSYLQNLGVNQLDYVMISHFHDDHYGGVIELLRDTTLPIGSVVSRTTPSSDTKLSAPKKTNSKGVLTNYGRLVSELSKRTLSFSQLNLSDSIDLGDGISLKLVAMNGKIPSKSGPDTNLIAHINKPNENDLSLAFVLAYDKFRYFTGGDLGGFRGKPSDCSTPCRYADIETGLSKYVGHVCAFKVNHHGSRCSTNAELLKQFNATVAIVSHGTYNRYDHPNNEFLTRLKNSSIENYFFTGTRPTHKSSNNKAIWAGAFDQNTPSILISVSSVQSSLGKFTVLTKDAVIPNSSNQKVFSCN